MKKNNIISNIYNPANQTSDELINSFVIRNKEFEIIINNIKDSTLKRKENHYVIQAQRGYGKTTLLLRIAYEIQKDSILKEKFIPVIFKEEEYGIRTLSKFWETVLDYLLISNSSDFSKVEKLAEAYQDEDSYSEKLFKLIEDVLVEKKQKLIVFIDNLLDILNKFKEKENLELKNILSESKYIKIISASSEFVKFNDCYQNYFDNIFEEIELKGLTSDEIDTLLLKLSKNDKEQESSIQKIIDFNSSRIEVLKRLTGGVPRTIVLLFEIFLDDEEGNSFKDLEMLLDRVTPLYKHRMDNLSTQQQEILHCIAIHWDAISTKEISEKIKMDSKAVSSQLMQLNKTGLIEKKKVDNKNNFYFIYERFFNIWYLMRYGSKRDKNRVEWLTKFFESWLNKDELNFKAKRHVENIKKGRMYHKSALYTSVALMNSNLLEDDNFDNLVETTEDYLNQEIGDELKTNKKFKYYDSKRKIASKKEFESILNKINSGLDITIEELEKVGDFYSNIPKSFGLDKKECYEKSIFYYKKVLDLGKKEILLKIVDSYYIIWKIENNIKDLNFNEITTDELETYKYRTNQIFQDKELNFYIHSILETKDAELVHDFTRDFIEYYFFDINYERCVFYYNKAIEFGYKEAYLSLLDLAYKNFCIENSKFLFDEKPINNINMLNFILEAPEPNIIIKRIIKEKEYDLLTKIPSLLFDSSSSCLLAHEEEEYVGELTYYFLNLSYEYGSEVGKLDLLGYLFYDYLNFQLKDDSLIKLVTILKNELSFFENVSINRNINKENYETRLIFCYKIAINIFYKESNYELVDKFYSLFINSLFNLTENNNIVILNKSKKEYFGYLNKKQEENIKILNSFGFKYFNIKYFELFFFILVDEIENFLNRTKQLVNEKKIYEWELVKYLILCIYKGYYNEVLDLFKSYNLMEKESHLSDLKDQYKPVYYVLMYYLQDKYPDEYKRMGSELEETVNEIIKEIEELKNSSK